MIIRSGMLTNEYILAKLHCCASCKILLEAFLEPRILILYDPRSRAGNGVGSLFVFTFHLARVLVSPLYLLQILC